MTTDSVHSSHTNKLNAYTFMEELGHGSFSTVRKVINNENKQQYACKIFPKANLLDSGDQSRFQREINAMAFIRHENIVALYDFFWDEQNFYLITDLCPDGELYDHIIKMKHFDEPLAALIFQQIATAVSVCHSYGIAHRDLKPENVLVDKFPHVKVSDFGLCGYLTKEIMMQTFCGSPCFCSPECLCRIPYDGRLSDVWSLGVILFFMVTGSHPWSTSNTSVMLHQILKGDYCIPPTVSPDLRELITGMLQVNPQNRFDMNKVLEHRWLEKAKIIRAAEYSWMNTIDVRPNVRQVTLKALSKECEKVGQVREFGIVSPFEEEKTSLTSKSTPSSALPQLALKGSILRKSRNNNAKAVSRAGRAVAFAAGWKRPSYAHHSAPHRAVNCIVPYTHSTSALEDI